MNYKEEAHRLVEMSKEKGIIKNYSEWCETEEAKEYALSDEEIKYYKGKIKKLLL